MGGRGTGAELRREGEGLELSYDGSGRTGFPTHRAGAAGGGGRKECDI